jgi:hemolysin D
MSAAFTTRTQTPAPKSTPADAPGPRKRAIRRDYQQFLPAAVAMIETPPSPIRLALSTTICALITVTLVWSWFGRIDVISEAQGKLQPTGRVKVVQPVDSGRVMEIFATNGVHVEAGDILVELDAKEENADADGAAASLAAFEAETVRRRAAIEGTRTTNFAVPALVWPDSVPAAVRSREAQVLKGDLAQLASGVAGFDAQARQKVAEKARLMATVAAQERLIGFQNERVVMRQTLVDKAAGTKKDLLDASESMAYAQTQLETQKGELAEAIASLGVIEQDRNKTIESFVSENGQKLADAGRQADDFRQRLVKAVAHLEHTTIRSPVAGTVTASSVTSRGQVVSAGDEIMRIVPDGSELEIEAYLPNSDIGFVKSGQIAEVKVESFPFTRYGTVKADVVRIARDAVPEPDATQVEGGPNRSAKASSFAGTQRVQNLVFPVVLKPRSGTIVVDGAEVALSAGMAVTVEIKTGNRRILEYVFSPLADIGSNALKER